MSLQEALCSAPQPPARKLDLRPGMRVRENECLWLFTSIETIWEAERQPLLFLCHRYSQPPKFPGSGTGLGLCFSDVVTALWSHCLEVRCYMWSKFASSPYFEGFLKAVMEVKFVKYFFKHLLRTSCILSPWDWFMWCIVSSISLCWTLLALLEWTPFGQSVLVF